MSFPDYLRSRIFEPLGMVDSFFWVPDDKADRFGPAYTPDLKIGRRVVQDHPANSRWRNPNSFPSGGAGLVSTADDYLKFARMILGKGKSGDTRAALAQDLGADDHRSPDADRGARRRSWGCPSGPRWGSASACRSPTIRPARIGWAHPAGWAGPGAYGTWWVADPKEDLIALMMIPAFISAAGRCGPIAKPAIYQAIDD